jgi:UDP-N-acetylglucosamine acyltransferase
MISSHASVHPNAKIGENVHIDPFVTIHEDVVIGDHCRINSGAVIFDGARLGSHVQVFPGAVISAIPQDLKYEGEKTTAEIGSHSIIREYVTINKGTKAAGRTIVGEHTLLMAYVHIAHDCSVGNHCILANGVTLAGHILIDDYAIIGGLSAIHQFCHIGGHVMIQGGALIGKDVPPFVKAGKFPLSYLGVNSVGLKRRGYSEAKIAEIQEIYRILFVKGFAYKKALEVIEAEIPASGERDQIIEFARTSSRGLMKGLREDGETEE